MVASLRVAFFGTPSFALTTLQGLHESAHTVVGVVTQPDRPQGRGQRLTPGPVKAFAVTHDLAVLQPTRLRDAAFQAALTACHPDIAVVAAYGRILPEEVLNLPAKGTVNVHASLLPRWRGAAPVHRAILAGDTETGVTIMRVVPALDAGPMLRRVATTISATETSVDLEARLASLGARCLVDTLNSLATGPIHEEPQPEEGVTYAHRLERHERVVDWARPAGQIHDQIRGLQPWPVATVVFGGRRLLLLRSEVDTESPAGAAPGTVVEVTGDAFSVAARPGAVRLTRVQVEGRSTVDVRQFLSGHRVAVGDRLEPLPASP